MEISTNTPVLQSSLNCLRTLPHETLYLLSQLGFVSRAHRAQFERPELRPSADSSAPGRRRTIEAAYKSINPQALVPALEDNGKILTQSLAIIEYLEEKYPNPPLLPADPADKAFVRSMALVIACEVHPIQNLRVLNYVKTTYNQTDAQVNQWAQQWIDLGLSALEQMILEPAAARQILFRRCADARRYLPDSAARQRAALRLRSFEVSDHFGDRERLAWQLPAFANAAPEKQPDAE